MTRQDRGYAYVFDEVGAGRKVGARDVVVPLGGRLQLGKGVFDFSR